MSVVTAVLAPTVRPSIYRVLERTARSFCTYPASLNFGLVMKAFAVAYHAGRLAGRTERIYEAPR